jgi:NADH-quinone oxidoreductase subunit J
MLEVSAIVFYAFAALLLGSAAMVIFTRHAVNGVLSLIVSFLASTVLWLLLHAEFLGLALLFVYVGAVMTLFLFVVMMLNVSLDSGKTRLMRYAPAVMVLGGMLVAMLWFAIGAKHFGLEAFGPLHYSDSYNNTRALGMVLYTDYVVPLELASAILLVAIISAIGLAFRGSQKRCQQDVPTQIFRKKSEQLQVLDLPSEQGGGA